MTDEPEDEDVVRVMAGKSQEREGVIRTLDESALAGGIIGFAVAAAALLAARFARARERRRRP